MSSSISADYSPASNYSYPTEPSLSPPIPPRHSRPHHDQNAAPPRLSSPHIFRDIFAGEPAGPSTRAPQLPPLHEIDFAETMQDVNRALQSANRAIQTAQEAFQSRRTPSANMTRRQDVVDLTGSPPLPQGGHITPGAFVTANFRPHDSRLNSRMASSTLNEPFYPRNDLNSQSIFVEEDDPTSLYAGQSDSLAGARRRYEARALDTRRSHMSIPNMDRHFFRPDARRHDDEEAIRRQRAARQQWENTQQRQRLQQQRDRIMATEQRSNRNNQQNHTTQPNSNNPSTSTSFSGVALQPDSSSRRPSTASSATSSVESVDLTAVNNTTDLTAALVGYQSANPTANPAGPSGEPRSALTGYKCPICLEAPRNATTTICGHLFCHECIIETLKNSENMRREELPTHRKIRGQCPVCRKELARKEEEGSTRTLVPVQLKLISRARLEALKRQEKKRQRRIEKGSQAKDKGKGKEKEAGPSASDKEIFELSSDDEDNWGASGSSQKENKAKRVKLSASEELDEELFGTFIHNEPS